MPCCRPLSWLGVTRAFSAACKTESEPPCTLLSARESPQKRHGPVPNVTAAHKPARYSFSKKAHTIRWSHIRSRLRFGPEPYSRREEYPARPLQGRPACALIPQL